MDIQQLATDFVKYYNSKTDEKIPDQFIRDYYLFTSGKYVSACELIKWLGIERNTFIKTLAQQYTVNVDYFVTTYEDEMNEIKVTDVKEYRKIFNQKYHLLTTHCFNEYATRSVTEKGKLIRKYYHKLNDIFKKFHIDYIRETSHENRKLLNNQRNSHSNVSNDSGVYVWSTYEHNASMFRIGCADNVYQRINQHNSSNIDKINICVVIYTSRFKDLEYLLKIALEGCFYRGEFYKCNYARINNAIKKCIGFMKNMKCINCDFNVVKYSSAMQKQRSSYSTSLRISKQNTKTRSKQLSKKHSVQTSKKQSKQLSKTRSKQISKKRIKPMINVSTKIISKKKIQANN